MDIILHHLRGEPKDLGFNLVVEHLPSKARAVGSAARFFFFTYKRAGGGEEQKPLKDLN